MAQTGDSASSVRAEFERLLAEFFQTYPNDAFRDATHALLERLLATRKSFPGELNAWAGGLVMLAFDQLPAEQTNRVPIVQLAEAFAVNRYIVRERACEIRETFAPEPPITSSLPDGFPAFSLRDEANAICAYAFRNGPIEDIHASVDSDGNPRVTQSEMRQLMIAASRKLAELLEMKERSPDEYHRLIRVYNWKWCKGWER
jgi:hypothetical protein